MLKSRVKVTPPLMHLANHFQGQEIKVKVTRPINADTHPAAYLPMQTYCVPLVGIFLANFRINLHQTRMQYFNEGPQRCN